MLIRPEDRVRLPAGVRLTDAGLVDPIRAGPIPLNDTGRFVVAHADGRTVGALAHGLATATGVPAERALANTLSFCAALNRVLLLNVKRSRRRVPSAVVALAHGLRPAFLRRRGGLRLLAAPAVALGALGWLAGAPLLSPGGALLLGLALGGGLALHELGHRALLRGASWCVAVSGLKVEILHQALPPPRRAVVAAGGPLVASLAGAAALAAAWWLAAAELALASAPLTAQALGLTVLAGDGRSACGLS
ncbi:MAG: PqqD family peptide modification chaperone [Gaiellaceae bacterium]